MFKLNNTALQSFDPGFHVFIHLSRIPVVEFIFRVVVHFILLASTISARGTSRRMGQSCQREPGTKVRASKQPFLQTIGGGFFSALQGLTAPACQKSTLNSRRV